MADHLLCAGDYQAAITEYKRFLFDDPECGRPDYVYAGLGTAYRFLGEDSLALVMFDRSARETPADSLRTERFIAVAVLMIERNRYMNAVSYLDHADIAPDGRGKALYVQGTAYLCAHRVDKCREILSQLEALSSRAASEWERELRESLLAYRKLAFKSMGTASWLSGIVPGTGQMSAGRVKDGINAFILNSVFASLTINDIREERYGRATIFTYFFLRFYLGNIINTRGAVTSHNSRVQNDFRARAAASLERKVPPLKPWPFSPRGEPLP